MDTTLLDQIKEHLTFLGYTIETMNDPDDIEGSFKAKHAKHFNFWAAPFRGGLRLWLYIQIPESGKKDPLTGLQFVNLINRTTMAIKTYLDKQRDVNVAALYPDSYSKSGFADFIENFNSDILSIFSADDDLYKKLFNVEKNKEEPPSKT